MVRGQWRNLHRWIFNFMGIFMLAWVVSGILILTPMSWFGHTEAIKPGYSADYTKITLSPADIISGMNVGESAAKEIRSVTLRRIHSRVLYSVRLSGGRTQLFDAQTGQPFVFTKELAEVLAREAFPTAAAVHSIKKIESYDTLYTWGSLPVYRLRFEDHPLTIVTVVTSDARVMRLTPFMGIRRAITGLHEFEPVKFFTDNNDIRTGLMIFTGSFILLGTLIGIYLAFPIRRKDRLGKATR